ncbi:DNA cytosine methyltransferase [Hellea balneolensis]|uniref:DNA cytosine methyltransferase n=1 Tax=Hellea balneolensis TaxID=287478 RepID=UPI0004279524|nr:DNA cytosine methyltransferase [Hellea balneolensis]
MDHSLTSIELFAGAAGLGLGAKQSGIEPIAVVEWNRDCRKTILINRDRKNGALSTWPKKIGKDVRNQDFREYQSKIDLVIGGPPCQPFSLGGKHQAQTDSRDMFPEAVRAVRETRPKAFIFENVRGLTRESFRPYFEYITLQMRHPQLVSRQGEDWADHLSRLQRHHTGHSDDANDYRVVTQVLNAADYGVPQQRHRVFFVGFRADLGLQWHFPQATHCKEALLQELASGVYAERLGITEKQLAISPQIQKSVKRIQSRDNEKQALASWKTVREALDDLPAPTPKAHSKILNHRLQKGARSYPGHTGSPLDLPAKTLKAGVHGVPGGENMLRNANGQVRYFTIRESARLQTFPDNFEISGTWSEAMRQLGNAVPVALGAAVASSVSNTLLSVKP